MARLIQPQQRVHVRHEVAKIVWRQGAHQAEGAQHQLVRVEGARILRPSVQGLYHLLLRRDVRPSLAELVHAFERGQWSAVHGIRVVPGGAVPGHSQGLIQLCQRGARIGMAFVAG